MTTPEDKGAIPSDQPSPITKETDEGQAILRPADVTIPEDGAEPTIEEVDGADGQQQGENADGQQQQQQQDGQQPQKRGKNRVPAKQRINQLWHEARQYEGERDSLRAENEALKRQMAEGSTKNQQINAAALDAHEGRTKAERDLAKRELIDAKAAGDAAKEAEATGKLARAEAELGNIASYRAANPAPAKANGQAQPDKPEQGDGKQRPNGNGQQQQVEVSPELQEWVGKNLWAVNDPRNAEFDPEMAGFMAQQAGIIEGRMRRSGRANEIGTQAFFDELDTAMREEFPDRFDDTPNEEDDVANQQPQPRQAQPQQRQQPANQQRRAPQMQRQNGSPVAAAGQSTGQQQQRAQPRTVQLSAEERSFAHGMAANGALKYPMGHKMQGRQMSPADAEVAYARQKLAQTK